MSKAVYTQQLSILNNHLQNAKTDRVRAVLMMQINNIKRELAHINAQPSIEYLISLEEKYATEQEDSLEVNEQTSKRGRKKKEIE